MGYARPHAGGPPALYRYYGLDTRFQAQPPSWTRKGYRRNRSVPSWSRQAKAGPENQPTAAPAVTRLAAIRRCGRPWPGRAENVHPLHAAPVSSAPAASSRRAPTVLLILDEHLRILSMNPAFRHYFMCSEAVCGRPISYLMDAEPFEQLLTEETDLIETTVKHARHNLVCHQIKYALREERQPSASSSTSRARRPKPVRSWIACGRGRRRRNSCSSTRWRWRRQLPASMARAPRRARRCSSARYSWPAALAGPMMAERNTDGSRTPHVEVEAHQISSGRGLRRSRAIRAHAHHRSWCYATALALGSRPTLAPTCATRLLGASPARAFLARRVRGRRPDNGVGAWNRPTLGGVRRGAHPQRWRGYGSSPEMPRRSSSPAATPNCCSRGASLSRARSSAGPTSIWRPARVCS